MSLAVAATTVVPSTTMTEASAAQLAKTTFINKVRHHVSALLPAPSTPNVRGARTTRPVSTPRRSCRLVGPDVEFPIGDLARRSTKRVMKTQNIIGDNEGINQQANEDYNFFLGPLSESAIQALGALFGWANLEGKDTKETSAALVI
jgi:hypothetical protein